MTVISLGGPSTDLTFMGKTEKDFWNNFPRWDPPWERFLRHKIW